MSPADAAIRKEEKNMAKKSVIPGFSWKRATGVTEVKRKISRATGVPLTKHGRKQKVKNTVWKAVFK